MTGKLYGVGVGPGDPKLLTYKAVEIIKACEVIAVPDTGESRQVALEIVKEHLATQELIHCYMPMTRNREQLASSHEAAANTIETYLQTGKNVAFLTLGDPTIYSTYMYLHRLILEKGYSVEIIPGVPSICAVAAKLNDSLCEEGQMLHIIPASYQDADKALDLEGTKVLMKTGKAFDIIKSHMREKNLLKDAKMVSCCGMEHEKVYHSLEEVDSKNSYFSVIVIKEEQK
ncbi:MAG: precorrin-2 C(20)-methyltransferase [Cellulosilyticaceae bacterium]